MNLIALFVRSDRFIQRDLSGRLLFGTEMHQQFIVNASRRVSCQAASVIFFISRDCLDQTDGSDGDEIFHIFIGILIFFRHVRYQAHIPKRQFFFCLKVAVFHFFQAFHFLFWCERR